MWYFFSACSYIYCLFLRKYQLNMKVENQIEAFLKLSEMLSDFVEGKKDKYGLEEICYRAENHNLWFTQKFIRLAMESISQMLNRTDMELLVNRYHLSLRPQKPKTIAVISAGNIPLVGFQDFFYVLISGNKYLGKLSQKDAILLRKIAEILVDLDAGFDSLIAFETELLKGFDAVIATGSNNSKRYFDYYFGKYPSIIRANRNSLAILPSDRQDDMYRELGKDIFYYFGLGCRSVSKLFVPRNFDFVKLLDQFQEFEYVKDTTKYFNNYEYNKSVFLLNKIPHFDTGFFLLTENSAIVSPISVVHYEYYDELEEVRNILNNQKDQLQCVVSTEDKGGFYVNPGQTQHPNLLQFADNVDVLEFLTQNF